MTDRVEIAGLHIARELHDFVVDEAIPGTRIDARVSVLRHPSPGQRRTVPSRQSKNHSRSFVGRVPSALSGSRYIPS